MTAVEFIHGAKIQYSMQKIKNHANKPTVHKKETGFIKKILLALQYSTIRW